MPGRSPLRPYALTAGRTRPTRDLRLTDCLLAVAATPRQTWTPEHQALHLWCTGAPCSVAELAARLGQPTQVARVLVSDLLDQTALSFVTAPTAPDEPDVDLLERCLNGLRALQ
ncbi:DUF742 domain-containing protein [Streptomyces diastaticus]|uniref:DUF742 domain-containing protein n=1 Tax=Streptomyces diastaticus TaxID=1956 RepID=UPI001673C05D|nr:DUF742 domain-containing protein [Streptomyces diastaticus]GGU43055.1 hypothetical protein GCM10015534_51960 [Streptomyces diastaticus subsp. diastaticus]